MAYLGRVFVIRVEDADEASFERYLTELARSIDRRPDNARLLVLYDVPRLEQFSATQRKRVADIVVHRRNKLGRTTEKLVLATASPFVRGMLQAVWWLAPPPYPYDFARDSHEAIALLAAGDPTLDAAALERDYAALLERWRRERDP